jgi:hypothetical protein
MLYAVSKYSSRPMLRQYFKPHNKLLIILPFPLCSWYTIYQLQLQYHLQGNTRGFLAFSSVHTYFSFIISSSPCRSYFQYCTWLLQTITSKLKVYKFLSVCCMVSKQSISNLLKTGMIHLQELKISLFEAKIMPVDCYRE